MVTVLLADNGVHIPARKGTATGRAVVLFLVMLLSLAGTVFLVRRIRRMPA